MRNLLFLLISLVYTAPDVQAQTAASIEAKYQNSHILSKGTLASPLEADYDVRGVKIDLAMTNLSTFIAGNTTTKAKVSNSSGLGKYVFELDSVLTIDSMKVDGVLVTPTLSNGYVRTVILSSVLPSGASFSAQVWYHGTPPSGTGFFTHGVNHNVLGSGTQITFTLSDPYLSKDWWPCKQALDDKIDSTEIWITVPAGLKAGCNGLLQNVTPVGSGNRYEWKTKYPIDYYLITASVAPYTDYSSYMHFTGVPDSMLIQHYLYDTATIRPQFQAAIDSTGILVDYFSTVYGRYPFAKEKYGHCFAPLGGGMEHQTMTTIGVFTLPLVAHELGHQWWGDAVTYNSWKDIWLSEGWASYTEQLFTERFRGISAATAYRTAVFNRVMAQPGGSVIVDDTTNVNRIFDSRLTYDKGASVAHMLRYVAPTGATFFTALRTYQGTYRYRTATTSDLKLVLETAYGHLLDTFFNQWVYGEGFPIYDADWNQSGNTVYVKLMQTASKPAVTPFFYTPLEIKLTSATGDTVITIYNNQATQMITFNWGRTMTGLSIDPDDQILNRSRIIQQDQTLAVKDVKGNAQYAYPNPTRDSWTISGLTSGATLRLYNSEGKMVWNGIATKETMIVPASSLPQGLYHLNIEVDKRKAGHLTLERL